MNKITEELLLKAIKQNKPYLTDATEKELAEKLCDLPPALAENLSEWINGRDLTDYLIREKYSVNAVLSIRNSQDVISAILDLAAYAKDEGKEFVLWQTRM